MNLGSAPTSTEFEVTLLGPGYGESIAIHLTSGRWIIVDSCQPACLKKPAALHYLESIGVDPASVEFLVATHWHDDHISGISTVLEACTSAQFVMASALHSREFIQVARFFGKQPETEFPGAHEMWRCLELLQSRAKRKRTADIVWATSGRLLFQQNVNGIEIEVATLSPSDADYTDAIAMFGQLVPSDGTPIGRPRHVNPNHSAVVLRVTSGGKTVLLGSDLETTGRPDTGWNAVVANKNIKTQAASLYKVAHHGSATGEHAGIWSTLLQPAPVSVLTPYRNGRTKLPTDQDQARIKSNSGSLWSTSRRAENSSIPRSVEKIMSRKARSIARSAATYGIVRARIDVVNGSIWTIEGFGAADQY